MPSARLLALDWGTSSLRASLLGDGGALIAQRRQPWGILHLPAGGFAAALRGIAGDWLAAAPGLPCIACGMVGSRQGWREADYVDCPADVDTLAERVLALEALPGVRLHIVPGVRLPGERPDLMRGEETQIVGVLARASVETARFVLPGTHSKWVQVTQGRIERFHTFMTGELYALLAEHSILGRPAREAGGGVGSSAAFERGVRVAEQGGRASEWLFSARTLVLDGRLDARYSLDYLSGLLIGDEIGSALAAPSGDTLRLVGEAVLCARYQRALALFGASAQIEAEGAAETGLWHIATRAGLLHRQ